MNDRERVALLEWAIPRLGLRWRGFKNLRRQVCRRVVARARVLGVTTAQEYRALLERDAEELRRFDALCFVTISRFYRDAPTFDRLRHTVLPALASEAVARGERTFRVWSAGCASGEEPYTIAIVWELELAARFPELTLDVLATDFDDSVLARAAAATYETSSLVELPAELRARAFDGDGTTLKPELRARVRFERRDIRTFAPAEPQHLVLCRNVAFTYFDEAAQRELLGRLVLAPGGVLVLGKGERLPAAAIPVQAILG